MNILPIKRLVLSAAIAACFSPAVSGADLVQAAGEADRMMAERKAGSAIDQKQALKLIQSITALIEKSSAAKQIEASGRKDLLEIRNHSRKLLQEAENAYQSGDFSLTMLLLGEAAQKINDAARQAIREKDQLRQNFDERMLTVKALLSAEKRIVAEKNKGTTGTEAVRKVETLVQEATGLAASGKFDQGREVLDRAYAMVRKDIGGLRGGETLVRSQPPTASEITPRTSNGNNKQSQDFDNRMASVEALLAAQKRIVAEKNKGATETEVSNHVEALMHEAATLATAGKLEHGREVLDQAYVMIKKNIESLRRGETLVRSLNFATKEEEYRYEIDRNDTHRMLVTLLLEEKRKSIASLDEIVRKRLDQAARLRAMAESSAARKDYESGIRQLEDSTREMVQAIRSAGVYIPG